jgi:hypothetical protein
MDKFGSKRTKESLRIFNSAILLPCIHFSKAIESNVSDIKSLHFKDFWWASWRTKKFFYSRWRNIKQNRIFVVVSKAVGNSSCLWILLVWSTIWFIGNLSGKMLSMRTCIHVAHCWADTWSTGCNTQFNSGTLDNIWDNVFVLYWFKVLSIQPTSLILYVLGAAWISVQSNVMKLGRTWRFQID